MEIQNQEFNLICNFCVLDVLMKHPTLSCGTVFVILWYINFFTGKNIMRNDKTTIF